MGAADQPTFTVDDSSVRLADFLRGRLSVSSDHFKRCLAREWMLVNDAVQTHKSAWLERGDVVRVVATRFQISQLRFREPLLRVVHDGKADGDVGSYRIVFKPGGMPLDGGDSVTIENALPAIMDDEHYSVVDSVGRITSGPVIVSLDDDARRKLGDVRKRYTFRLIVHGNPPDMLDIYGFVSLSILETVESTSGTLSVIEVVLQHSGDGLRGCLKRIDCPILGTSASIKSAARGCFFACTQLELLWKDGTTTAVHIDVPDKFHTVIVRERKFFEAKRKSEAEEERKRQRLRMEYVNSMEGESEHLLLKDDWSATSFCGLSFYVTDDVMSPRSSSEVPVKAAKEYLPNAEAGDVSVLDLGTGSGCLLVSTLMHAAHAHARGVGIDISADALKIAEINVRSHGLSDRIELYEGDFKDLSILGNQTFDVVLCNPPYLTEGECKKDGLTCPRVALVAENKGLACYEAIARQVERYLKPKGLVVLEVGGKRKVDDVRAIFGSLDHVETRLDDQGQGRCLVLGKLTALACLVR